MLYRKELYLNLNVGVVTHDHSDEGSLFQIEEVLSENDFNCLDNLLVIDGVFNLFMDLCSRCKGRVGMNSKGIMKFRNTVQYNLFEKELLMWQSCSVLLTYFESDVI